MAKVAIKSEKLTPFGGKVPIMEQFSSLLSSTIDSTLGLRSKLYGYQYSEIIRSLLCVYFCGGSCVEDITTRLMGHLSLHPTLRTCSADTILRAINELARENISYTSDAGKSYDFNTADTLNTLLLNCLLATGQLKEDEEYDVDFDHQFIETEKYDAKPTYKKFLGYRPGVAVIGDMIVGIENSDGNTNVRFHQEDTLKRIFERREENKLTINRFRADCSSYSENIVDEVWKHCKTFYIRANRCCSLYDDMNNGFGWGRLPKSFMAENTVFLLLTALIRNFYKAIMQRIEVNKFGLKKTSCIKTFVFKFISVPAKWIKTARQYVLNIYTNNHAYAEAFKTSSG